MFVKCMTSCSHQFDISYKRWWSYPLQKKKKKKNQGDEYVLFKSVELDDTLIKNIDEGSRELYSMSTKFLRYAYVGL